MTPIWISHPGPCCGIAALAHLTGVTFDEAFEQYKRVFKKSAQWKGTTKLYGLVDCLKKCGLKITNHNEYNMTLTRWIDQHARPTGHYLVRTGRHFQAVTDQVITDQNNYLVEPADFWGKQKRVTHAVEVRE